MTLHGQDCSNGLSATVTSNGQVKAIFQSERDYPSLVLLGCSQASAHRYDIARSRNPLEQFCPHLLNRMVS